MRSCRSATVPGLVRLGNGPKPSALDVVAHTRHKMRRSSRNTGRREVDYARMLRTGSHRFHAPQSGTRAVLWLKKVVFFWAGFPAIGATPALSEILPVSGIVRAGVVGVATNGQSAPRIWRISLFILLVIYPVTYYVAFSRTAVSPYQMNADAGSDCLSDLRLSARGIRVLHNPGVWKAIQYGRVRPRPAPPTCSLGCCRTFGAHSCSPDKPRPHG